MRRDLGIGCVLAALSVGCGHARVLSPRFASIASHDEAILAYACEDRHELVDVGRESDAPRAEVDGSPHNPGGSRVRSGTEEYVIRLAGAERESVMSAARGGEAPRELATGVLLSSMAPDGRGAVLVTWLSRELTGTPGAILHGDAIVPLRAGRRLGSEVLGFLRIADHWLAITSDAGTTYVWRVDESGEVSEVEDLGAVQDVVATEQGGERAIVWGEESGLQFRAGAVTSVVLPAEPGHGWLRPVALLRASDGDWLVATESWLDAHFVASDPQLHVVHVGLDGTVLGTARTALRDGFTAVTASLEGDAVRVRLDARGGTRVVGVVPRPCTAPAFDACAPRTWRPGESPLTGHHWEYESGGIDYQNGDIHWTLPLSEEQRFMPLLSEGSTVGGLLRDEAGVWVVSLDPRTGERLAARTLGDRSIHAACATPDLDRIAVLDDAGATLLDLDGRTLTHIDGAFEGCALAALHDRLAWALERTQVVSSAGPMTNVELVLLSPDGRTQLSQFDPQRGGRAVSLLATDAGVWLGWASLGVESYWIWPLDPQGTPLADPHRMVDLRLFPATALAVTELGPSLLWSSTQEEGVVPLCHVTEGSAESRLMSATFPSP